MQVAAYLNVETSWVYRQCGPGASDPLPFHRIGRYLRFRPEEIEAWVRERAGDSRAGEPVGLS